MESFLAHFDYPVLVSRRFSLNGYDVAGTKNSAHGQRVAKSFIIN